ncbi:hypothetical protein GH714_032888 [Hevea brasiliensis]|uniref:BZIP domain-containing protein n=1 Tax=Hevea brasiliensis TaxID=3981 RepID=A0A6A6LL25_HEVBR|nr:hypothetical protein GH714_032888 [Hevea brasiliensis]
MQIDSSKYHQIRAQFDSIAPKRPAKPNRSESAQQLQNQLPLTQTKSVFLSLTGFDLSNLNPLYVIFSGEGAVVEQDEFVETHYYKELDSIDKQHHMTGSGFIRVVGEENTNGYNIELPTVHGTGSLVSGCRSNPATNDWTPSPVNDQNSLLMKMLSNASIDEKKRKRMTSNRESARRSRMRRQKKVYDLINEKVELEKRLNEDNHKYVAKCQIFLVLESENEVLRAKKMELIQYLKYLNQILISYKESESNDSLQVSEPFMNLSKGL